MRKDALKNKGTVSAVDKVMGSIVAKTYSVRGEQRPFESKEDMNKYAMMNLGADYQKRFPEVASAIEEAYPGADEYGYVPGKSVIFKPKGFMVNGKINPTVKWARYVGNGEIETISREEYEKAEEIFKKVK